jgi:hypothetical protein
LRRYVAILTNKAAGDRSGAGAADRAEQQHLWK